MAKTVGALLSREAHGTLAGVITYQSNPRNKQAHKRLTRHDPETAAQLSRRSLFAAAVSAWQALSEAQKDVYRERASDTGGRSGYNIFISEYTPAPPVTYHKFGTDYFGARKFGGP